MEKLKIVLLYLLPVLLIVAGSLDFFKLEPAKSEMEAMNLGGTKMIFVGVMDWILAIGIIVPRTQAYALIGVLFLSSGALVAHIVSGQMGKFFITTLLPFFLALTNLIINFSIFITRK